MAIIIKKKEHVPHSFERLVNNLIHSTHQQKKGAQPKTIQTITPKINILERENEYVLQLALPGWVKSDIDVQVDEEQLIVKGNKEKIVAENITYHSFEFDFGQFEKRFALPQDKFGDVNAEMKEGILSITIVKKAKVERIKKIAVN